MTLKARAGAAYKMAELLQQIAAALRSVKDNLPQLVTEVLDEAQPELEDLITAQLNQGIDGSGNAIEPEYTPFTKSIKRLKGQPSDIVTLRDEGDFERSRSTTVQGGKLVNDATDRKYPKLVEKYGDEIIDYTEESKQIIQSEILLPGLNEKIRTRLSR
jgi:hypothetical protein